MNGRMDTGRARRMPKTVFRDRAGSVLVWFGLTLPVILGMSGLGFDATLWYMERRITWTAADSAALAAVYVLQAGGSDADIEAAVMADIGRNELRLRAADRVTVNMPPATGPNAGDANAVEVLIQRRAGLYFASVFFDSAIDIDGRAVGGLVTAGVHCVVGLDETAPATVEFDGTADADIGCGVISNSSSHRALLITGDARLIADPAQAFGDIEVAGNAELVTLHPVQPYSQRVVDPYGPDGANLQLPSTAGCVPTPDLQGGGFAVVVLDPGVYCGDLRISNRDVTFNPGTYVFVDGDIDVGAGAILSGTDVTFILTGTGSASVGTLKITGGTTGTLAAPANGPYAGVLFFQDPDSVASDRNFVQGGSTLELLGAVYFPNQEIIYTGGAAGPGQCVQIIGRKVTFSGHSMIVNEDAACAALGVASIEQIRARLIE